MSPRSRRFVERERRELRREVLITPDPELGLVAMNGPNDPEPGLKVEQGRVVWFDGRSEEEFDAIDYFIAWHGLDLEVAVQATGPQDPGPAPRVLAVPPPPGGPPPP